MLDARADLLRRTLVLLQKIDQKFMVLACNGRFQRVPMENRFDELLGSPFGGEGLDPMVSGFGMVAVSSLW
jgi:hypothetical protein